MQRFVVTWASAGNPPDLQISLQGFVRLPAPSKFVTITPLHLNIPFDMTEFRRLVQSLNPDIRIFEVSCATGAGIDEWVEWLIELTDGN